MEDWRYYCGVVIAAFFGFLLRYVRERKKTNKVDAKYLFVASFVIAYVAWLVYYDKKIAICGIRLWVWLWSYFASLALSKLDEFFTDWFKDLLNTIAQKIIAVTEKKRKP